MEGDGIHRKEIPEIPVDAMREAVINSFAHARYDLPVQHEIDIFSDRISIVNPGSFAKIKGNVAGRPGREDQGILPVPGRDDLRPGRVHTARAS